MTVARKIESMQNRQSWIRKMFEEGAKLKAAHGSEKVFDFSLGNPNIPPPPQFKKVLLELLESDKPGDHGYMPNVGYPHVRAAVAKTLSREQETQVDEGGIIMTCGAAGALNTVLKTILDPGDEILCPAPYFVEYATYADNHGGILKTVATRPDFTLDLDAIAEGITDKTKGVLINSPNNPTGEVYSKESLQALGDLLAEKSRSLDRTLYLISDEPYRKIVYDGVQVPGIFPYYRDAIVVTSYSKDLSIPGERIGYIAVNPAAAHRQSLCGGLALSNRILGFVNAPALMQRAVAALQGVCADLEAYARKRKLLCDGMAECGYAFTVPKGAFYLFPRSPIEDDVKFVQALQEELILAVPGSGFMGPGHFRLAFCVDDATIQNALPGFRRAIKQFQ